MSEPVLLRFRPWIPARWATLVVACFAMGVVGWRGALGDWSFLLLPAAMLLFVAVSSRWVAVAYEVTPTRVVRRIGNLERAWRRDAASLEGRVLVLRAKEGRPERVPVKDAAALERALGREKP